jgi:UDPglucose 6-dehydrogenase
VDFGLCYSPQFIALGSVIHDFLNPDLVLVGESDPRAGALVAEIIEQVCDKQPAIARMSWVNAELAKISVNTYVTMKITFANMLAALCEQLPGGDVDVVTKAIGFDTRIGARYLKGALGYGGPCFPRDNMALAYLARQLGEPANLPEATDAYNRAIVDRIVGRIRACAPAGASVAVLGLAYKPDTNVVEEAQGVKLAAALAAQRFNVTVYDPVALDNARAELGTSVTYAGSVAEAAETADVIVIANPDPAFRSLPLETAGRDTPPIILDGWRFLKGALDPGAAAAYISVGLGAAAEELPVPLASAWMT